MIMYEDIILLTGFKYRVNIEANLGHALAFAVAYNLTGLYHWSRYLLQQNSLRINHTTVYNLMNRTVAAWPFDALKKSISKRDETLKRDKSHRCRIKRV